MLTSLLELLLPLRCAACGAAGALACAACLAGFARPAFVARPTPCPPGLPLVLAATAYAGPARVLLLAHKERGRPRLAGPLGAAIGRAVTAFGPAVLVPVPSSPAARRARGYDHAAALAAVAGRTAGLPVARVLRVARRVDDATALSAAGRLASRSGVFAALPGAAARVAAVAGPEALARGSPVVLVDDVVTTGATLADAARAARAAGLAVAGAAVVAATARHTLR